MPQTQHAEMLSDKDVSHAQFRALANSIPNLAWMAHPDGWIFWYNKKWYDYTGTTPQEMAGWGWQSVHHPDTLPLVIERWVAAIANGQSFEMVFPLKGSDGVYRQFLTRTEPLLEQGKIVGWFGTNTEITEQVRAREKLQLIINELNHRVKNTLATVQSIAVNSFKELNADALQKFNARLQSLSAIHDVLTRESWERASLNEIIFASTAMFENRVVIEGENPWIDPRVASLLSMMLSELCINAAKHGALSNSDGSVHIETFVIKEAAGDNRMTLVWTERGGPPVAEPTRKGFGTRLLHRSISSERDGTIELKFKPSGVTCRISIILGPQE